MSLDTLAFLDPSSDEIKRPELILPNAIEDGVGFLSAWGECERREWFIRTKRVEVDVAF